MKKKLLGAALMVGTASAITTTIAQVFHTNNSDDPPLRRELVASVLGVALTTVAMHKIREQFGIDRTKGIFKQFN